MVKKIPNTHVQLTQKGKRSYQHERVCVQTYSTHTAEACGALQSLSIALQFSGKRVYGKILIFYFL